MLAEHTSWDDVDFVRCTFLGGTYAGMLMSGCTFEECVFEGGNFAQTEWRDNRFVRCTFTNVRVEEPTWHACRFVECKLDDVRFGNVAFHQLEFTGGTWHAVHVSDALLIETVMVDLEMEDVIFADVHAPKTRLERVRMRRVFVTTKGFSLSELIEVHAEQCGFISYARFDETKFRGCRFVNTGFGKAVFTDAELDASCRFVQCNLNGTGFLRTRMEGARFAQCTFLGSLWLEHVHASHTWFYQCQFRGVDLRNAALAGAVLADSDLTDARLDPGKTIKADFRGTVRAAEST